MCDYRLSAEQQVCSHSAALPDFTEPLFCASIYLPLTLTYALQPFDDHQPAPHTYCLASILMLLPCARTNAFQLSTLQPAYALMSCNKQQASCKQLPQIKTCVVW